MRVVITAYAELCNAASIPDEGRRRRAIEEWWKNWVFEIGVSHHIDRGILQKYPGVIEKCHHGMHLDIVDTIEDKKMTFIEMDTRDSNTMVRVDKIRLFVLKPRSLSHLDP